MKSFFTTTALILALAAPAFSGNGNCGNCQGNNGNGNGNTGGNTTPSFDLSGGISIGVGAAGAFSKANTAAGSGVNGTGVSEAMGEAGALQNSSVNGRFQSTGVEFDTITEGASYGRSSARNGTAEGNGKSFGFAGGFGGFVGGAIGFD